MSPIDPNLPPSWRTTPWPLLEQGRGQGSEALRARWELVLHYHEVVRAFFLKQLRDPGKADELYSTFTLRLGESDRLIKSPDPARGRFRVYLKEALRNMVRDYFRRQRGAGKVGPIDGEPPDATEEPKPGFDPLWRQELLNQAWKALEEHDRRGGQIHYLVLRHQSDHPEQRAPQIAEQLAPRLGRELKPDNVRQALHRAREKFAELLLEEVERSLEDPTPQRLEEELIDLQLLSYCRKALDRRCQRAGKSEPGPVAAQRPA